MSEAAKKALKKRGLVFRCLTCEHQGNKPTMEKHVLGHHLNDKDVPYKCGLCRQRFLTAKSMKSHVQKKHNGKGLDRVVGTKLPLQPSLGC